MYTIKEASSRTGIAIDTIRAWERRYAVVEPTRTESGYRLYDEAALSRLDAMRRLVAAGWQPSVAAAEIRAHGLLGAAAVPESVHATEPPASSPEAEDQLQDVTAIGPRFVAAAAALDEVGLGDVLDDLFARGSFERVVSDILFPALQALGEAWATGEVSVAGEHLASQAVQRRLGLALDSAGRGASQGDRILVGLPAGGRHELGALAFAVAARRAGLPVAYVGADLPTEDWISASGNARGAVIGVPTVPDRAEASALAVRLLAAIPGLVVAVGGIAAPDVPGVVRLPVGLLDGVAALRAALSRPAPGRASA